MNNIAVFRARCAPLPIVVFLLIISKFALAATAEIPTAPHSFPFDASRNDTILDVQFRTNTYRNYIFTLEFHHEGGDDGMRMLRLIGDGNYKIFTRESADTSHPISPAFPNTLEGSELVAAGVRNGKFVSRPTDFSGTIPIHIKISRLNNQETEIITDETIETLGYFSGGSGKINRIITVEALKPGIYRLQANTIQNSQRFIGATINLGITYHPNTKPLQITK